jgi:hypothetical protein
MNTGSKAQCSSSNNPSPKSRLADFEPIRCPHISECFSGGVMQTAADYRTRAEGCLEMADRAQAAERAKLLEIASAWVQLAEAAESEAVAEVKAVSVR